MEKAKTNAKDTAERKAAVRQKAAAIASCVVLAALAAILLYWGFCSDESFAKSVFLCVGIIEALIFAGFEFGLKPFHFMRAAAFALVGFAIYFVWCEPELFGVLLVAPHLALGLLSYKPPIWCSVLLGLFGFLSWVLPNVIFMVMFYNTYNR